MSLQPDTMTSNPLKWTLNPNPNLPFVEAFTLKWRYEVHADVSIDGHWVAHREFTHRDLSDRLIGELLEDTFCTFEEALAAAESWQANRAAYSSWRHYFDPLEHREMGLRLYFVQLTRRALED